ncbi:MAG: thiamine phosphate synthase [Deltaproteobacteria bacterium]|nr:thiamine phosphate synthase [Deltaproteobacteria bacterium]
MDSSDAFGLYLILTDPAAGYRACAEAAVAEGVRFLQLRMKNVPPAEVLVTAQELRQITRGTGTLFIVNDFVDVAREAGADGVHLGQEDMGLARARELWPERGKIFGLSTHDEEQERAARALSPDYVGVGPVWATPTKEKPDPTLGLSRMGAIVRSSPLCTVAIGGINADNLPRVLEQGAKNFAVVRAVNAAAEPRTAIRELMDLWRSYR